MLIMSIRSLTATGFSQKSHLLLCGLPKTCKAKASGCVGSSTDALLQLVAKDLDSCFHGVKDGEQLGNGFRMVLWSVQGDCENLANELHLPHYAASSLCAFCPANRSDIPFTDFRPNAACKQKAFGQAALAAQDWVKLCPLLKAPSTCPKTINFDIMHLAECNGVVSHCLGNTFFELLQGSGKPRAAGTQWLWGEVQDAYQTLGISANYRAPSLSFSNIADASSPHKSYPCLTGVKARCTRYLAPVALLMAAKKKDTQQAMQRFMCLKHMCAMLDIVDEPGLFLSTATHTQFQNAVEAFLLHYSWLAKWAMKSGLMRWNIVPKHHYLSHLPEQARWLSPGACRLYGAEDYVGRLAHLSHACLAGTPSHKVSHQLCAKYRLAVHLWLTHGL